MKPAEYIKRLIKNAKVRINQDVKQADLTQLVNELEKTKKTPSANTSPNTWRIIIKSKMTKLAVAAVMVVAILIGINMFTATPVWAIDQTVHALENVQTIIISGTGGYNSSKYVPFKCWIKLNDENGNLLMRFESPQEIVVVQGDKVCFRRPGSNKVKIIEGPTVHNLKFWYKIMELSPWLSGKMLQTLKPLANDWQEDFGKDEKTGRESVFVNCSYKQLSASFWFVFDIKSKLIVEAKHWSNSNYEEPVNLYAGSFVYNEDIPDKIFNFEMPDGAKVVYQNYVENRDELVQKAWKLFKDNQYAKALKIYQEADDLFMVGLCYDKMGEHEKAIEFFKEVINREEDFQGSLSAIYFYLANSYMQIGQKEKAIEAFENCLHSGKGFRDTEGFPMKNASECIEKLKNQ
ncbi:MAG: tetratricopeptide repeat protein [Planctomycetes bacterium]|nr:tetratricopeptide repeat protein [Planctomycetota bacterium]